MPHSTFSKIYDVLTFLSDRSPIQLFDLSRELHDAKIESFAIWRRAEGTSRATKGYCSEASIRRLVRFAEALGLARIENQRVCEITAPGRNALVDENYPVQLGAQLLKYMRETLKFTLEDLEKAIKSIKPPKIADNDTLFQTVTKRRGVEATEEEFRRLLYLLQRCGKLAASVKKVYSTGKE